MRMSETAKTNKTRNSLITIIKNNKKDYINLLYISQMEFPTLINWISHFHLKGR